MSTRFTRNPTRNASARTSHNPTAWSLALGAAAFTLTGQAVTLTYTPVVTTPPATTTITSGAANMRGRPRVSVFARTEAPLRQYTLRLEPGRYALNGGKVTFTLGDAPKRAARKRALNVLLITS